MEHPGNIPTFNIPGTLFRNIRRNFIGNFFWIYQEYIVGMLHQYSTNRYLPGVCVCVYVCVCVCLYSSTSWFLPAAWRLWHTWDVRNNDLLLRVLLGASAKFLHLHFWVYHISPPKTKIAADSILERK